ncbi:MAG: PLP-dependent aspartate aminotransferase family protein [Carboxydocellales bacterium]
MKLETRLVQTGVKWDTRTGAVSMPIYQSATFQHPRLGESTGFDYSRSGNPTRQVLEEAIAAAESGQRGLAFASGMAAITTLLYLFRPGDHLIVSDDLYGGTYRLFEQIFNNFGLEFTFVDTSDLTAVEAKLKQNTKAVFIETPSNPLMKITDIRGITTLAKSKNLLTIVDNTFMTPFFQRPLELGADIIIHSGTKYLGGHNDLVAGLLVTGDQALGDKLYFYQNATGAILGPQDCWLLIRGLKTLGIRLERQQENALLLAQRLQQHLAIEQVFFPGLADHPGHQLHLSQATGYGGMLAFKVKRPELVPRILERIKLIAFAESLGGVETLITYPTVQTHADIPQEIREAKGISNTLLRLSVGIEAVGDLIEDLEQAIEG